MRKAFAAVVLLLFVASGARSQTLNNSDAIESVGQGKIDWTIGEVYAAGIGVPPAHAANPAQARAMAERAAMIVALRNLLEIVKGVRVDSETVVENFIAKSDIIRTRVEGVIRGAMPVKKQYLSDGSVEIVVGMKMKGEFLNAIIPETFGNRAIVPAPSLPMPIPSHPAPPAPSTIPERKPEPSRTEPQQPSPPPTTQTPPSTPPPTSAAESPTAEFKGGKATGIVIDGRGLGLRPALLPKILDSKGLEIYVGQVVTRTNAVEQGVAGYAKDVNAAANNFRVTDNPAIIRGLRASGTARTDIVLGSADAQMLSDMSKKSDFLQYCRVIIVY